MKSRWLVALAVLAGSALAACSGSGDDPGAAPDTTTLQDGGSVVVALDQAPAGWNPNKPRDYTLVALTQHVLPAPFRVRPDFEVVMDTDLLVRAEVVDTDPHTVEYVIRDEARWSDGTPITGEDFRYVWEEIVHPANEVASVAGYEDIDRVETSDNGKRVRVVFSRPFGDWRSLFTHLLPAHIMRSLDGGWDALDGSNIPTFSGGPFALEGYRADRSVRLVANPDYWGENKPVLDEIIVRFNIAAADLPAALENDEVDLANPPAEAGLAEEVASLAPEVEHAVGTGLSFDHLDFNLDHEFLGLPAVRQAIAHALDEQALVDGTVGRFVDADDAAVLQNRIYGEHQDAYVPHGQAYEGARVEEATEILERAGFTMGADGIYEKDGRPLSFRLATTGGNSLRESAQTLIQSQLRDAGIDVRVDNDEGSTVFRRIFPADPADRDFDAALFSWVRSPFPSGNEALYTTGSPANVMGYSSTTVDDLFVRARRELDEKEAAELYNRIDEILWRDVPTIPLYATPSVLVHGRDIANVKDNVSTAGPLWNAYEWALVDR